MVRPRALFVEMHMNNTLIRTYLISQEPSSPAAESSTSSPGTRELSLEYGPHPPLLPFHSIWSLPSVIFIHFHSHQVSSLQVHSMDDNRLKQMLLIFA